MRFAAVLALTTAAWAVPSPIVDAQQPARRAGEMVRVNITSPEVIAAANAGVHLLETRLGKDYVTYTLISAQTQVVKGTKYVMVLKARENVPCRGSSIDPICASKPKEITITVVDVPWGAADRYTLLDYSMAAPRIPAAGSGHLAGGMSPADIASEAVIAAAKEGMRLLNLNRLNGTGLGASRLTAIEIVRLVSAQKQVVTGTKYKIVLEAGESQCANDGQAHDLSACPVIIPKQYTITVVDTQWHTPRYILLGHFEQALMHAPRDCVNGDARAECVNPPGCPRVKCAVVMCSTGQAPVHEWVRGCRQCFVCPSMPDDPPPHSPPLVGGWRHLSTTDPRVLLATKAALGMHNKGLEVGSISLLQVVSASSQMVAGMKLRITFKGGPMTCPSTKSERIMSWLSAGHANGTLNQFGDESDAVYLGGSPLFDERTGSTLNLEDYVVRMHPNEPWDRSCRVEAADQATYVLVVVDKPWKPQRYTVVSFDNAADIKDTQGPDPDTESERHGIPLGLMIFAIAGVFFVGVAVWQCRKHGTDINTMMISATPVHTAIVKSSTPRSQQQSESAFEDGDFEIQGDEKEDTQLVPWSSPSKSQV